MHHSLNFDIILLSNVLILKVFLKRREGKIGPGKVLSGFVKKIDKTAELATVEDQASLEALLGN